MESRPHAGRRLRVSRPVVAVYSGATVMHVIPVVGQCLPSSVTIRLRPVPPFGRFLSGPKRRSLLPSNKGRRNTGEFRWPCLDGVSPMFCHCPDPRQCEPPPARGCSSPPRICPVVAKFRGRLHPLLPCNPSHICCHGYCTEYFCFSSPRLTAQAQRP